MSVPTNKTNILSKSVLQSLRSYAQEISYPAGETIIHRGDPGAAFYIITSGRAEIILGHDQNQLPLARLSEGASFGEISLFTNAPVSADVKAVTDTTLLAISAEQFQGALAASAPLRNHIFVRLCNNLRQTSSETWDLFQHTQALSSLMHLKDSDEPIIFNSTAMAGVKRQIDELNSRSFPVLITGEAGTGKLFAARKVHQAVTARDEPLFILDCQEIDEKQAGKILFGRDQAADFIKRDSSSGSSDLLAKGTLHLADKGSIILRHIDALDISAQKTLCIYLDAMIKLEDIFPKVRLIATTGKDLSALAKDGRFHPPLAEHLKGNILEMPSLRKRKRDILPLAELFLKAGKSQTNNAAPVFTKAAEHMLLSSQYQHRNVAELREAVELAVTFAQTGQIDSEHIFTGPKNQGYAIEYDLTRNRPVQWLIQKSSLRFLQGLLIAVFAAIIALCFTASDTLIGRIANTLVWAAWWPALLVLFLFVGRIWCTVCPISAVGRISRLVGSMNLTPPAWVKNRSGWIMAFLFLIIIWTEHIFHMTGAPFATGILLLSLMSAPIVFCLTFQREMWCRYLCPLGSLAAGYSVCSTVQVHANPNVCASQCTTHDCFKGSRTESGCPVFHHPLYASNAHLCKLCFACLRNCPHQSAKIYLHPPLQNLWRLAELGETLAPLPLFVFFLAIVMLASQKLLCAASAGGFTFLACLSMALAFALNSGFSRLFANNNDHTLTCRIAFSLLILAWGPFMSFHLGNIPELDAVIVQAANGSVLSSILNIVPISFLFVSQFAVVMLAALCTAVCLWRIWARQTEHKNQTWQWSLVIALCGVYLLTTIVLILHGVIL